MPSPAGNDARTLDELPCYLIDAIIAMEDRRFYDHFGVDPRGMLRAAIRNYRAGFTVEGGSTITQQLVRTSFLTREKTIERKLREALLAMWVELRLSKKQILERYLSSVYFGGGCYGVRAAARHFFNKDVRNLSVGEAAFLVALLPSPSLLSQDFASARERAALVIKAMIRDGRLPKSYIGELQPLELRSVRFIESGGYYADWLAASIYETFDDPNSRRPLKVYSTFEPELQRIAQNAVESLIEQEGNKRKASQAALVAMRTDGRVVAMVGGLDRGVSQFNRAV